MKTKFKTSLLFILILLQILFFSCDSGKNLSENQNDNTNPDNPNIQYIGRIDFSNPEAPMFFWPGSSIIANFEGTSIKLKLNDSTGENYFNVFLDDNTGNPVILDCVQGYNVYNIASGLKDTIHKIEIFKRTEDFQGPTSFLGFVLDSNKTILTPPEQPKRRIEFYGNSITVGMGNECDINAGDDDDSKKNNYLAYGAITAKNLNAAYICIAKSGIGLLISWFDLIMPEMWDRLDPSNKDSKWDFSQWIPHVVVVNLFQNDSWLINNLNPVPNEKQIKSAYIDFIRSIRSKYPDAHIFCTLGSMDATKAGKPWPGYVTDAVNTLNNDFNDSCVHNYTFAFDQTGKHPRVDQHIKMANELTEFIKNTMEW